MLASAGSAVADDTVMTKAPTIPFSNSPAYNWTGFYAGSHIGYVWGSSNWTASTPTAAPNVSGSLDLFQPFNAFDETGSFFEGLQAGYNHMLPNRVVIGAEVDASFPSFQNRNLHWRYIDVYVADAWRGQL